MSAIRSRHIMQELAKVFGLEGRHITRMKIELDIHDAARITINELVQASASEGLVNTLACYELKGRS